MSPPDETAAPDDDHLDGCDLVIDADDHDDDETSALRPLFPQGRHTPDLEAKAKFYRALGAVDA